MAVKYERKEDGIIVVRDPIYGKIVIRPPFSEIIFTKEMQRLEDIGQNGFSIYDYPGLANNERLSHSIGAFYLMSQMITKIESELLKRGITISQEEKDLALCSMLLHDIGHGPFSHDCERVVKYSHEKRTTDILLEDTQIHRLLVNTFGEQKTKKIASYIAEINDPDSKQNENNNFSKLLKSLISYQLDADRLDYLLRDSYHAGIISGIDYKKIINGLGVSIDNNKNYEVVINENALSAIETILIERFQRYRDVYFSITANIMKLVFPEVLKRYVKNPDSVLVELPEAFRMLAMHPQEMPLEQFITLTDTPFLKAFSLIQENTTDPILRHLCDLENLKKHYQLLGENVVREDVVQKLQELFPDKDLSNTISVYTNISKIKLYKKEQTLKINCGKSTKDISEVTDLIKPQDNFERRRTFFDPEVLRLELGMSKQEFKTYKGEIEHMLEELNKAPEEFELKYILSDEMQKTFTVEDMLEHLAQNGFTLVEESEKENDDKYYDTKSAHLLTKGGSLRVRKASQNDKTKYKGTFKMPKTEGEVYSSRDEIEAKMQNPSFEELKEKMQEKQVPFDLDNILPTAILNSVTQRKDFVLEKNGVRVCLSFDQTEYTNYVLQGTRATDCMVEIEALGDVSDRVILNEIHSVLNTRFPELKPNKQNKYLRGVQKTKENYRGIKQQKENESRPRKIEQLDDMEL